MTTNYVGGLRYRLIYDSAFRMLNDCLEELGWFEELGSRTAVTFVAEEQDANKEIKPNTVALADTLLTDDDYEMGSNFGELNWTLFVDIFAENKATGIHISGDVRDILRGRMSSLGRTSSSLDVYDWTLATPVYLFTQSIENVRVDRGDNFGKAWLNHWYAVSFDLVDYYGE